MCARRWCGNFLGKWFITVRPQGRDVGEGFETFGESIWRWGFGMRRTVMAGGQLAEQMAKHRSDFVAWLPSTGGDGGGFGQVRIETSFW